MPSYLFSYRSPPVPALRRVAAVCSRSLAHADRLVQDLGHIADPYVMARMGTPNMETAIMHSVRVPPTVQTGAFSHVKPPTEWRDDQIADTKALTVTRNYRTLRTRCRNWGCVTASTKISGLR